MSGLRRVLVALSGGVDSAVTAVSLAHQGWMVRGVYLRLTPDRELPAAVRALGERFGFPVDEVDVAAEFRREVIDYFTAAYRAGRTPNPCVRCNAAIKFQVLQQLAREGGEGHVATGHYVRRGRLPDGTTALWCGRDAAKEQSYFLHRLKREELSNLLFPLGDVTKGQVAALARQWQLTDFVDRPESQELCFIPQGTYQDYLTSLGYPPLAGAGEIVDRQGRVLGRHRGLAAYTIGQRQGLGIAAARPYYVLAIVPAKNQIVVGHKEELAAPGLLADEVNWLIEPPQAPLTATVRIRYRHPGVGCRIIPTSAQEVAVIFDHPQTAVTPGQAAVFYQGDRLLGGGWIRSQAGGLSLP